MMEYNQNNSLRDFIFGANDGLAISLIIMVGFSAGIKIEGQFLLASVLILLWGSTIASLSIFSTGNSELKAHKRKISFIKDDQSLNDEIEHTRKFMSEIGLDNHIQNLAIKDLKDEREAILLDSNFNYAFNDSSPTKMALNFFTGFILAGLIPLFTFHLYFNNDKIIFFSLIIASPFLFILSYLKGNFTGVNKLFSALSYTFLTVITAMFIYSVTNIFS